MLRRVSESRHRPRRARSLLGVVIGLALLGTLPVHARAGSESPIRGYWVSRAALDSPEAIRRVLTTAQAGGFDTVFVPIPLVEDDTLPGFDGVRECIREARERKLHVQAWIEVNRVAGGDEFPASRTHIIYRHPEWLMLPRALASEMLTMDPRGPAYLGQLSRWTRLNQPRIDGLYISPLDPDAAAYLTRLVSTTVQRYVVDGVHLDAVRFPGSDFDYSRRAMELFRASERPRLTLLDRARLDEVEAIDPFGYSAEFPADWSAFRQARLTALVTRIHDALRAISPLLTVTANVPADETAREEQFQDWHAWVAERLIDGVGTRSGNSMTILLSADGLVPPPIVLPAGGQASAAGGSR